MQPKKGVKIKKPNVYAETTVCRVLLFEKAERKYRAGLGLLPTSHDEISQMRVTWRANCLLLLRPTFYSCFRSIVVQKKSTVQTLCCGSISDYIAKDTLGPVS